MRVDRLSLHVVSVLRGARRVAFRTGPQVVVGPNATGKTNLLESLVVLGTSRSHRAGSDGELDRLGRRFRPAGGSVARRGQQGRGRHRPDRRGRRAQARPGQRRRPPPVRARRGAAGRPLRARGHAPRRRLAGRRGATRSTRSSSRPCLPRAPRCPTYGRALTQRNNLLRAIRDGSAAPDELHYWDGVVIEDGAQIVDWRRATLAQLARAAVRRAPGDRAGRGRRSSCAT